MSVRPLFLPRSDAWPFVEIKSIDFEWFPGFSRSQVRKSIASLHQAAEREGFVNLLEICSHSPQSLGASLSAFNLTLEIPDGERIPVECAYQGSKVFENGGPLTDLFFVTPKEAKTDERIRNSSSLIGFEFLGEPFPTQPATAFYDWLYLTALSQNPELAELLLRYEGFTDIAFNPEKSINCQARSAALYVILRTTGRFERVIQDREYYLDLVAGKTLGPYETAMA